MVDMVHGMIDDSRNTSSGQQDRQTGQTRKPVPALAQCTAFDSNTTPNVTNVHEEQ